MSEDKPRLAAVHPIAPFNFRQVSESLRGLADRIDRQEFGEVKDMAIAFDTESEGMVVFHFGQGEIPHAHFLLHRASVWLAGGSR